MLRENTIGVSGLGNSRTLDVHAVASFESASWHSSWENQTNIFTSRRGRPGCSATKCPRSIYRSSLTTYSSLRVTRFYVKELTFWQDLIRKYLLNTNGCTTDDYFQEYRANLKIRNNMYVMLCNFLDYPWLAKRANCVDNHLEWWRV